ncbi:MAG: SpoIID/LytB domain-containing protein, partial [Clostridiales bacterium]|nr:SpoIID/LytB domain-containing protein [Clostridiales bacterium]
MRKSKFIRMLIIIGILIIIFFFWSQSKEKDAEKEKPPISTKQTYENAWIVTIKDDKLIMYADGSLREFEAKGIEPIQDTMADVVVKEGKVKKISLKTEIIGGKVLAIGEDFIEIEGYGKVPLAPNYAFYKNYENFEEIDWTGILVGYEGQNFIVGNGQICGAIIIAPIVAKNIRVLIMTDNYQDNYHKGVKLTSASPFSIDYKGGIKTYEAGEIIEFTAESDILKDGRIIISPMEDDKMSILSIERGYGVPYYRGRLEISKEGENIVIINELSLEEYLYSVVPSEMPPTYGLEALKAQAVCARSYAYKHMLKNSLSMLGAHVNDSAKYQVYNNLPEHELSTKAVDETMGQIMVSGEEVVEAYYFSTSCGHTTDADIWGSNVELSYISGKLLSDQSQVLDLTDENTFAAFIKDTSLDTFDSGFPWYRWHITFALEDLTNLMNKNTGNTFADEVKSIQVTKRGTGGIATELTVI